MDILNAAEARVSRRRLLQGGAAAVAAAAAGARVAPSPALAAPKPKPGPVVNPRGLTKFVDALPIPPAVPASSLHGNVLHAAAGSWQFHSGLGPTPTWGYTTSPTASAAYLGPTIVATAGVPLAYTARNRIAGGHLLGIDTALHGAETSDQSDPRIAVHLHGGYVAPASDGGPDDTFTPGGTWDFSYPNDQGAATLWYHDHALGITRLNAYAGLAGLYVISDGGDEGLLPTGPFDIPLALQDKSFLGKLGTRAPNPLYYPNPWAAEFFGNMPVVNGKAWPTLSVDRGYYRFRLLNGSSARFYHLRPSSPRVKMWVVATDSGRVRQPVEATSVVVSPGERVEIVLDLRDAPSAVTLDDVMLPPDVVSPAPGPFGPMVQLKVGKRTGGGTFVPGAVLNAVPAASELASASVRKRTVSLVEHIDPATGMPVMSLLNNLHYDTSSASWEKPASNTVEVWEIVNLTADTHPIHMHLVHFLLLDRQGFDVAGYLGANPVGAMGAGPWPAAPATPFLLPGTTRGPRASEMGWKDTIQAHPGEVTRIVVPFGPGAHPGVPFGRRGNVFTGKYVWHCHILDHEDHEMMLPYEVVA